MKLEDLLMISNLTTIEVNIIIELKKSIKDKTIIAFFRLTFQFFCPFCVMNSSFYYLRNLNFEVIIVICSILLIISILFNINNRI